MFVPGRHYDYYSYYFYLEAEKTDVAVAEVSAYHNYQLLGRKMETVREKLVGWILLQLLGLHQPFPQT